jgi:hypothetical protein
MKKVLLVLMMSTMLIPNAFGQTMMSTAEDSVSDYKYSIGTTYLTFLNFGEEKTNTQHYEFHFGYQITPKDKISIKIATWKMFAPMGMPMLEQLKFDESNFYPGRLKESGIGLTYQRMLSKNVFFCIEVLPQLKTYLDENDLVIANGFKLYTSYHLGYHISLFKGRVYIEPQMHSQYWPINTDAPQGFKDKDDQWNNYFLFEPNIYIGINF